MPNKISVIKNVIALFLLLGQGNYGFGQTDQYEIDLENSSIRFTISHMGVLTVKGEFQEFSGALSFNNKKLLVIECAIAVESINTKDKSRDATLLDKGYLDANEYPFISFISTTVGTTSRSKLIKGILKIKDVEKEILMPFQMIRSKDSKLAYLNISTVLRRTDFDLDFGPMDVLIGNDIKVVLKIAFLAPK